MLWVIQLMTVSQGWGRLSRGQRKLLYNAVEPIYLFNSTAIPTGSVEAALVGNTFEVTTRLWASNKHIIYWFRGSVGLKAASRLYALLAPHLSHIEHRGRLFERRLDANVLTRLSIRLFADNFPFSIVSAVHFLFIYHIQLAEILESGRIRRENPGMDGNCDGLRLSLSKDKSAIPLLSSSSSIN